MEHAATLNEQHRVSLDAVVSISRKEPAAPALSKELFNAMYQGSLSELKPGVGTERGLTQHPWTLGGRR